MKPLLIAAKRYTNRQMMKCFQRMLEVRWSTTVCDFRVCSQPEVEDLHGDFSVVHYRGLSYPQMVAEVLDTSDYEFTGFVDDDAGITAPYVLLEAIVQRFRDNPNIAVIGAMTDNDIYWRYKNRVGEPCIFEERHPIGGRSWSPGALQVYRTSVVRDTGITAFLRGNQWRTDVLLTMAIHRAGHAIYEIGMPATLVHKGCHGTETGKHTVAELTRAMEHHLADYDRALGYFTTEPYHSELLRCKDKEVAFFTREIAKCQ